MTLVLVMAFNISVALALGFVFGRIYQIRSDELGRRVEPPPVARIPGLLTDAVTGTARSFLCLSSRCRR
jgi:hypothetical protein